MREGFFVPAAVKQAWGAQLVVLSEVDRVCRKCGIKYYAEWGTLLGCIRHGGYVPWDDDLDIGMFREDYDKFVAVAKDELPAGYDIIGYKTHEAHNYIMSNVVGKSRICFEKEHLETFHGFPYIAGLDIFVLDYVARDKEKEDYRRKLANYALALLDEITSGKLGRREAEEGIASLEQWCKVKIDHSLRGTALRNAIFETVEKLFGSISENESDCLTQMMAQGLSETNGYLLNKEWYEHLIRVPFEEISIPVPIGYDDVLHRKYGDYMKLVKAGGSHGYPYFERQKDDLKKVLDFDMPGFKYDTAEMERCTQMRRSCADNVEGYKKIAIDALKEIVEMCACVCRSLEEHGVNNDCRAVSGESSGRNCRRTGKRRELCRQETSGRIFLSYAEGLEACPDIGVRPVAQTARHRHKRQGLQSPQSSGDAFLVCQRSYDV